MKTPILETEQVIDTPSQASFNDALAASRLAEHSRHFEGQKFLLGLHCHWIKAKVGHGKFGLWLQKHEPSLVKLKDGVSPRPGSHLSHAMSFCEKSAWKAGMNIKDLLTNIGNIQIPQNGEFAHGGEVLMLSQGELPDEDGALKSRLLEGIQKQLALENKAKTNRGSERGVKCTKFSRGRDHQRLMSRRSLESLYEAAICALSSLLELNAINLTGTFPKLQNDLDKNCERFRAELKRGQEERTQERKPARTAVAPN